MAPTQEEARKEEIGEREGGMFLLVTRSQDHITSGKGEKGGGICFSGDKVLLQWFLISIHVQ